MNPIKDGTKQQGTDIDSLLDATYATPAFSIETDDLLDLQNLKSLTFDDMYTQAYA